MFRKETGITLIALIVTIIVLLILAGVTIAMLIGENGILNQAQNAKAETEQAEEEEMIKLAHQSAKVRQYNEEDKNTPFVDLFEEELGLNGLEGASVQDNGDNSYTVTLANGNKYIIHDYGTIEYQGETTIGKTDGSYDEAKGVNTPKLKDEMKLVKYDEESKNWIKDDTNLEYSYEEQTGRTDTYNEQTGEYGTSRWANAMLDGNYYVWIPRYAYKIDTNTKYTSQSGESYKIDVKFLIGETNKYYDENGNEKEAKIATSADEILDTNNTDYYVHPAFTFGEEKLEGLWIGKYESSDGGNEKVSIVPNATSLTNINLSTMFTRTRKLSKTNIDAHILKNTEWGAVAYLAQSQYGRNGTEISVNQCNSYITGVGKGIGSNPIWNSTYSIDEIIESQRYNGEIGKLSSTTGNVYGIYDMSGGAWEYVMGIYGTNTPTPGDSGFTEEMLSDSKYYNLYTKTSADNTNIGDALYETSEWNNDNATFVYSYYPFFRRGGYYGNPSSAGVFYFYCDDGMPER